MIGWRCGSLNSPDGGRDVPRRDPSLAPRLSFARIYRPLGDLNTPLNTVGGACIGRFLGIAAARSRLGAFAGADHGKRLSGCPTYLTLSCEALQVRRG